MQKWDHECTQWHRGRERGRHGSNCPPSPLRSILGCRKIVEKSSCCMIVFVKKCKIWCQKASIRKNLREKSKFCSASPLSKICSCLLENCNLPPAYFLTHDAAVYKRLTAIIWQGSSVKQSLVWYNDPASCLSPNLHKTKTHRRLTIYRNHGCNKRL